MKSSLSLAYAIKRRSKTRALPKEDSVIEPVVDELELPEEELGEEPVEARSTESRLRSVLRKIRKAKKEETFDEELIED